MVKIQKPAPKKLANKPKLDNPIKQKKQLQKKEKSATTNKKTKLLDDSTPVKKAKVSLKPSKEVITNKKPNKKELNGVKKAIKKPLILAPPESPEQKQIGRVTKNHGLKGKNVSTNGVEKVTKSTEVSVKSNKKVASIEKPPVSEKPAKVAKEVKAAAAKPTKAKVVPVPVQPKAAVAQKQAENAAPQKKGISTAKVAPQAASVQKKPQSTAPQKKGIAPAPAAQEAAAVEKKPQSAAPQKRGIAPAPAAPQAAASQKKPESTTPQIPAKPGKKQKNKKKAASEPEPEPTQSIEKIKKVKKPKAALQEKKKLKIAFKKAKLAAENGLQKKKKSKEVGTTFRYDPIPYDEDQFHAIVNTKNIKKIAEALKSIVENEVQKKKSSIFDDYRYFLQIASFKIPNVPKRMVKLHLKHSLVDKDDDVLLVVPDLKRGGKIDYEPTKHHYEDLLREKGVEGITVMPMNQLRREYRSFEQKRRLCASYEYFMCDGRIVGFVASMFGRLAQRTKNTFHAVRLNEGRDIKAEIEKSLKKTAFRQLDKSNLQSIPVGSHKFSADQLAENIELVVDQLKRYFPGGLGNIRNLHLKIGLTGTSSLPLYISMAQVPEETPSVLGLREERMVKLRREANEVLTKFSMTKEGKMIKLTKAGVVQKRKVLEMKAALKKDEDEEPAAKKSKNDKKDSADDGKKKNKVKEVKELEVPENEEEDDDTSDEDGEEDEDEDGQGSEDETEDDGMANLDEEDTESGAEIVENGLVDEDDEESEEDDEQEVIENENDEDDDDEDEDDDDDDEDDDEESD